VTSERAVEILRRGGMPTDKGAPGPVTFDPDADPGIPPVGDVLPGKASLRVFHVIAEVVIYGVLVYYVLLALDVDSADRFGTTVVSPIMTVLAGAAGFYFGRRTSE